MIFKYFLLAILPAIVFADDVLDLSSQSSSGFKKELANYDTVLVEFFAPWCGHCKRLAPEYAQAATELKNNDPQVPLAKVDCTSDSGKELCSEYGVNGYPTLKIFKSGEFAQEYNGPRESGGIVKYMKSQVGPASKLYENVQQLVDKLKTTKDFSIVGLFKSESDALAKSFHKTAAKFRESLNFAHLYTSTVSGSLAALDSIVSSSVKENSIVLVRPNLLNNKFENNYVTFTSSDELNDFISSAKYHGLVGHRSQTNMADFKAPLIVAYYDVDYVKNAKGTNYWRNRVLKVAQKYADKWNFAVSNSLLFAGELEEFGATTPKDGSPVVLARDENNKKYVLKEKFSVENLEKFVKDLIDGKVEAFVKSEDLPEDNNGPVKVAVGKNFDDLVLKSKKDVFIEFYAPWCGHCKKLAPTFEELGKALENEPNVDIVKMDATANDVTGPFVVHGFPTLYFLPSDSKQPKKYEGGRDLDDFVKYISKHATTELKGYTRDGKKKKDEL